VPRTDEAIRDALREQWAQPTGAADLGTQLAALGTARFDTPAE
jgi:hypothetical protein